MSTAAVRVGAVAGVSKDDRIEINGHDITTAVRRVTLAAEVGELTTLTLDLGATKGVVFDGKVNVHLDEAARYALLALGWTPPPGEPESVRFWVQVDDKVMDRVIKNDVGWTVLRRVNLRATFNPFGSQPQWLVEVADPNAPPDAAGKLLTPTFTERTDRTVFISNYGIPADES